jgi:hypothetical protein
MTFLLVNMTGTIIPMLGILRYVIYALGITMLYRLLQLALYFWRSRQSPLWELPGPREVSFFSFLGEFYDIRDTNVFTLLISTPDSNLKPTF